jgi:hypothetical protein
MLRTELRLKMYDLLDAIGFMLPQLMSSPTYSVFKQVYDTSDLTLACDLFIIKTFTSKLMKLIKTEQAHDKCLNLTYMGQRVMMAVCVLADGLRLDLEGLDVLRLPTVRSPPKLTTTPPSLAPPSTAAKSKSPSPIMALVAPPSKDEVLRSSTDSFMDMVNSILNSPPITARTTDDDCRADIFTLPPLPPSFKAIAKSLCDKPSLPSPTGTVVMGIPSLPNSARGDAMYDSKRTSSVILISPRNMDECMGMLRIPSLTMSERMAFL